MDILTYPERLSSQMLLQEKRLGTEIHPSINILIANNKMRNKSDLRTKSRRKYRRDNPEAE